MNSDISDVIDKLKGEKEILIFGARLVAKEVSQCLAASPFLLETEAFLVSSNQNNPQKVLGKPVIELKEATKKYSLDFPIVIACMEKHINSIFKDLKNEGFTNTIPLTFESDEWSEIQGAYIEEYCKANVIPYKKFVSIDETAKLQPGTAHIFSIQSVFDKYLSEQIKNEWEISLQVGTSLSEYMNCRYHDNSGENISEKNRQYCELTGMYWIWKNDNGKVKGLSHYRRHFNIDKKSLDQIADSDIDMLVTIPILNFPNIKEVYANDHVEDDWEILKKAVNNIASPYSEAFTKMECGKFYYAYNMFIAKSEVFDAYCEWLFPILKYCEDHCGNHVDLYQNRFIGFLAERLLTVFIIANKNNLHVEVISKHFIK